MAVMPIRLSNLFLRTLREDPNEAEVDSHKLLLRAGYIRRAGAGLYTWLPLGLAVKAKIEQVVREEMATAGAQEVFFPALLPREPFEATGRWTEYGDNLFRLQDRKKTDYLLLGENAGSKLSEAKNLGVRAIEEKEFRKMCE